MVRQFKIVVERTSDGYVAYPLGLKGIVVGQGDTYEEAVSDVKSAIQFHIETFEPKISSLYLDHIPVESTPMILAHLRGYVTPGS